MYGCRGPRFDAWEVCTIKSTIYLSKSTIYQVGEGGELQVEINEKCFI